MLLLLSLVTPIFGLIAIGFVAARLRYTSAGAGRAMTEVGYKVAMPALLFQSMTSIGDAPTAPLQLAATYVLGGTIAWLVATLATHCVLRRPAQDAPAIAMGACFSNGVMLGFPVILSVLGPAGTAPMAVLALCETALLWVAGTLHMGLVAPGRSSSIARSLLAVVLDVARNPLILAMLTGLAVSRSGVELPEVMVKLIGLVAMAAVPVSLIGLGLSLNDYEINGQWGSIAFITACNLIALPILALLLGLHVFELPTTWAAALAIYVAMPVGANAFVFATRYERAVGSISAAVAISTPLAVFTVTTLLAWMQWQGMIDPR